MGGEEGVSPERGTACCGLTVVAGGRGLPPVLSICTPAARAVNRIPGQGRTGQGRAPCIEPNPGSLVS